MDAASRLLKSLSFCAVTALVTAAAAQAQPSFVLSSNNLQLVSTLGQTVTVTSSGGSATPIAFTTSDLASSAPYAPGDRPWLVVNNTNIVNGTTPGSLSFGVGLFGNQLSAGNHVAQVTISATDNSGALPVVITINYSNNGPASGTITASVSQLFFTPSTLVQQISFSTGNSAPLSFVLTSALPPWLTLSVTSGGPSLNNPAIITATANPANLGSSSPNTTLVFSYNNGTSSIQIQCTLNASGGSSGTLTASPGSATWNYAIGGAFPSSTSFFLSSSTAAQTYSATSQTNWLLVSTSGINPTTSFTGLPIVNGLVISPSSNITTLAASSNPYTGTVALTASDGSVTTVFVYLYVSGTATTASIVAPNNLNFVYETTTSQPQFPTQIVQVGGSGSFTTAITYNSGSQNWLSVNPTTGNAPQTTNVTVNTSGLVAGTYSAFINYSTSSGTQTVQVNLLVSASTVVYSSPGVLSFTYQGGSTPLPASLTIFSSDNSAIQLNPSTSTSWLSIAANTSTSTPATYTVTPSGAGSLANGVYTGSIVFSAPGAADSSLAVPVVLTVVGSSTSGGSLILGASSLTFNAQANGLQPSSQTLSVSATNVTNFSVGTSVTSPAGSNWLSVSPSGTLSTNINLTVSVNQTGIGIGNNYQGAILLTANGVTQSVPVYLNVSNTGGGSGNVLVTANNGTGAAALNYSFSVGGAAPAAQTLNVNSPSGAAPVSFTVSTTTQNGGTGWLSTNVTAGTVLSTPYTGIQVTVSPSGLAAGVTYNGTVAITPQGGAVVNVPVTLVVMSTPTVSATPTTLNFSYQAGADNPPASTIQVSGGAPDPGLTFSATAATASGGNWLAVSPATGTTPATVSVSVNPSGLALAAGNYTGTVTVNGTGSAAGSTIVNVNLSVTAPLPTISALVNAANFASGAIAPGEVVSIGGTNLGPTTPATLTVSNGQVATTLGGVQAFFNGIAAPLIYVSGSQINAIVPYEIKGSLGVSVLVKFLGQSSNGLPVGTATTAPAIFTQNASGTGPGAILNQDNTVNTAANPAAKGSIVQVFMTGEGQTSPAGVTGKVNANITNINQLPVPLLPVGALINNSPGGITFAGEAPNLVSGIMQVNVQIPQLAANVTGPVSIAISVGGNPSQSGVTVFVK